MDKTRAIVTVIGEDRVGIVAKVATTLADSGANIEDISQTLMQDLFTMIMLVSLDETVADFSTVQERLRAAGEELGMKIDLQQEDVFRYMHRV
jgi:ACT domain-containing protein